MTNDEKLSYLMGLPWTVVREAGAEPGYNVLRVRELPELIATGADEVALEADFWNALEAVLTSYLEYGDAILCPGGQTLPWEETSKPRMRVLVEQVWADAPRATTRSASVRLTSDRARQFSELVPV